MVVICWLAAVMLAVGCLAPSGATAVTGSAALDRSQLHVYQARCERAVDGDTFDLVIDVGFRLETAQRVRLLGVDAPEVTGATKLAGVAATSYVAAKLHCGVAEAEGWPLLVRTQRQDSFGRWLADVTAGGEDLAGAMLRDGHAVPYVK